MSPIPSNFAPGAEGKLVRGRHQRRRRPHHGQDRNTITLPAGIVPEGFEAINRDPAAGENPSCEILAQTVACETEEPIGAGRLLLLAVEAKDASAPEGTDEATAEVGGGGASEATGASTSIAVKPEPVPFSILPGFAAPAGEADGSPTSHAGAHPYQETIEFGFPTKQLGASRPAPGTPATSTPNCPAG